MAQKKSFTKDLNPAMQFITQPEEPQPAARTDPPEGYKLNPLYVETKSKRLQLLLQPSLYAKIKAAADGSGRSVNDYVHSILEAALGEEQ